MARLGYHPPTRHSARKQSLEMWLIFNIYNLHIRQGSRVRLIARAKWIQLVGGLCV